jgi:hypothetical protein
MLETVLEECEQDQGGVVPSARELIADRVPVHLPHHETFLLQLPEASREHPRGETGVVAPKFSESGETEKGDVPDEEQHPLAAQALHRLPDRVVLVEQRRGRPGGRRKGGPPTRHRYPGSPYPA